MLLEAKAAGDRCWVTGLTLTPSTLVSDPADLQERMKSTAGAH